MPRTLWSKPFARYRIRKGCVWSFVSPLSQTGNDLVAFCIIYRNSEVGVIGNKINVDLKVEEQARNEYPMQLSAHIQRQRHPIILSSKPQDCKYNGNLKSS